MYGPRPITWLDITPPAVVHLAPCGEIHYVIPYERYKQSLLAYFASVPGDRWREASVFFHALLTRAQQEGDTGVVQEIKTATSGWPIWHQDE